MCNPIFLLKGCVDILLSSITKLVNLYLAEGVFPQKSKKRGGYYPPHKESIAFKRRFEELSSSIRTMLHVKIGGAGSCQTAHASYQQ